MDGENIAFAEDNKSVTVSNSAPCVMYAKLADGSYQRVRGEKVEDNRYSYNLAEEVTGGYSLLVAKKGDIDGDGEITVTDITRIICARRDKTNETMNELTVAMSDVTDDGKIDVSDIAALIRCKWASDEKPLDWQ